MQNKEMILGWLIGVNDNINTMIIVVLIKEKYNYTSK